MTIGKKFTFEAAHQLENCPPCDRLHGHSYQLEVILGGRLNKQGMVKDFKEVKRIVEENVISKLDHYFINDILTSSTAENILVWIFRQLNTKIKGLKRVSLSETASSVATIEDKDFLNMLGE